MLTLNHFNFNVSNLERSLQFYQEALGLREVQRKAPEDGRFIIVFLGDGKTDFRLELTWLRDHPQPYDLGECEFHLAMQAGIGLKSSQPGRAEEHQLSQDALQKGVAHRAAIW